jgi:hypothetical protein
MECREEAVNGKSGTARILLKLFSQNETRPLARSGSVLLGVGDF